MRDPNFSGHATGELVRARRELAASAALAVPGSGAHLMTVTHMQAIDAELAARASRVPFAVDEVAALAALEEAWAGGGYHAFGADGDTWSAISSAGDVLTGATPDELDRAIRAHWAARQ